MVWNGVHFNLHTIIPWPIMLIWALVYFGLLAWAWGIGREKPFSRFKTIDFVYIALIAALMIVYNFFISPIIPKVSAITTYFYYPTIGEAFLLMLAAALVGKPGSAGLTMFIYTLLSDIIHYGFGGEPFWFVYEVLGYAALIDLWLIYRNQHYLTPFTRVRKGTVTVEEAIEETEELTARSTWLLLIDGAIGGLTVFIAFPLFYRGFFATFVEGYTYTVSFWAITTVTALIFGAVIGLILAPLVYYIKKVVT